MEEIWKPVSGYEGFYCVSSFGKIKSIRRDKVLIGNLTEKGYPYVILSVKGTPKTLTVHRLVASHFIENTEQKPCVNHKDCDKTNNNVENLEWVTYSENNIHSIKMGKKVYTYHISNSKLTLDNVNEIRKSSMTNKQLATKFNVDQSSIWNVRKSVTWKGC